MRGTVPMPQDEFENWVFLRDLSEDFAGTLKHYLENEGMSITQAALEIGISKSHLYNILTNQKLPGLRVVSQIADWVVSRESQ